MASPLSDRTLESEEDAAAEAVRAVSVDRVSDAGVAAGDDLVVREEPLEIRIAGASVAVVMRTPGHDEELALGFLVTERVVSSISDIDSLRHCSQVPEPDALDNVLRVVLAEDVAVDLVALQRNFFANSSCGICGKASIENALAFGEPLQDGSRFSADSLFGWVEALQASQPLFARTGGLHAAGLFAPDGTLLVTREDVGRHNAVDKVIGWALRRGGLPLVGHGLLVSGRCSFEIIQKAQCAGIPLVAAVSAPTSLAVEFAETAGVSLVGFLRGRGLNVYSGRERVVGRTAR